MRAFGEWFGSLLGAVFVVIAVALLFMACGGSHAQRGDASANTAPATFGVQWGKPDTASTAKRSAPLDCATVGVTTVSVTIYDAGGTQLVTGGPWPCSAHTGTISAIPVGTGRQFKVDGKDSTGTVLYSGTQTNVTIATGVTNDAGTITALPSSGAALATVTGVSASAGNGKATISWSSVSGAASYKIYWGTAAGVTTTSVNVINNITTTSYTPTGLTNGTTYYYIVTAVNSSGESVASAEVSATPSATSTATTAPSQPLGVSATGSDSQVVISWTAVSGATSYKIYWSTASGLTTANGKVISGVTSATYTHSSLTNGTPYYYIVTAVNGAGESVASSQVGATPSAPATTSTSSSTPGQVTGVSATGGNGEATISWTAVTGATSYNVYYRSSLGVTTANGTKVTGATSGSAVTGLTNGTTYYFVVTAVNSGGESVVSSEASATPTVPAPTVSGVTVSPTNVTSGNNQTVSWSSTNQHHYGLYLYNSDGTAAINTSLYITGGDAGGMIKLVNPSTATSVVRPKLLNLYLCPATQYICLDCYG